MQENALTVLVIEDEDFISGLISKSLKEEGYSVIVTSDYQSSIKILATGIIHLVISDVMLPYTGGLDILDYVRADKKLAAMPVILVTGMDPDVLASSAIKPDALLPKPFEMAELMDLVNQFLGKTSAE